MDPQTISFDCGETLHKQKLTLTFSRTTAGQRCFILRKSAACQRDSDDLISGITAESLRRMADAVETVSKMTGLNLR
jgi:hypothetical protein